jgi:hypothetical protein
LYDINLNEVNSANDFENIQPIEVQSLQTTNADGTRTYSVKTSRGQIYNNVPETDIKAVSFFFVFI